MNWSGEENRAGRKKVEDMDFSAFSPDEQTVLRILKEKNGPMMIDDLTIRSSLSPSQLAALLLTLEFSDVVRSLPGKQFSLKKK
jgi:DNA processing protein